MCPVDNMVHLTTIFSCRRKNNWWPMVLFFNNIYYLDITGLSMIDKEDAKSSWNSLVRNSPMITYKVAFKKNCLKWNVRNALKMIGKLDDLPQPAPATENRLWKRCRLCPTQIDKKTPGVCNIWNINVCPAHSSKAIMFTCVDCQWNSEHCYQIRYVRN